MSRELIAQRAYELWQREGCLDGRDVVQWLAAERMIGAENDLANEESSEGRKAPQTARRARQQPAAKALVMAERPR